MTTATDTPLGVLLAGGKSSRLGRDKAWLTFFGQPLLCRVADVLARVTGDLFVSGRDPIGFGLDAPWLPDETPDLGPAGGVLTVLTAVNRPCLVVSCDLPFLDEATLTRLVAAWRDRAGHVLMTAYRIVENGYLECLVAVYDPGAIPLMRSCLARDERRLSAMFPEDRRLHVDYSRADAAVARAFFNINAPPDLKRARGMEDPA
jgi:molybdopterin-guanine dinucleotide biosynthesis protein A